MNNGSVILLLAIFGSIALMYAVLYLLVRWGNKRERIRQQQQVVEETSDPRAVVRVLASVRLQASWFIKMLLWVTLLLLLFLASLLGLMTIATLVSQDHKPGYTTSEWVELGLIIVGFPSVVWGLWECRVSYREILPEKLMRVNNRGRKLTLHYWQFDSSYFTINPLVAPGAKTIAHIKEEIEEHHVNCLFAEPQFTPKVIDSLAQSTKVNVGRLDPIGDNVQIGPNSYANFLQATADSYAQCLSK
ncbi:MAG: metal ABC transporter solute-binding protein, Zn/Mn family [Rothia dentocariosa]